MVKEWRFEDMGERQIWIPYMCDSAHVFATSLRRKGYHAEVLPRSDDPLFTLGRKYTDGDQCLPSIITLEDMLRRVFSPDFDSNEEAFFQGSGDGPCRFGRYYMNQTYVLEKLGFDNVPVVTLSSRNAYAGLGRNFKLRTWNAFFGQAMLERMLHFTRPLEVNLGETERVYKHWLGELCDVIEDMDEFNTVDILCGRNNVEMLDILRDAYADFSAIERKDEDRPVIFVTGEIFVRTSDVANQNLIRRIEELGGVALLEPPASFFTYILASKLERRRHHVFDVSFREAFDSWIELFFVEKDARRIEQIFGSLPHDPSAREVIRRGSKYVHPTYEGEAIITLGAGDYFASNGVGGVISAVPHNCMPGMVCIAKSRQLKQMHGVPFLSLSYDGHTDPGRDEQLQVFMHQVMKRKK